MDTLAQYFATIPALHRALILAGGIAGFWLLEHAAPLVRAPYPKWRHAGLNLFLTLTTIVVNFILAFILVAAADWVAASHVGLLQWVPMPLWAQALVGLLVMDLVGAYLVHWLEHKVRFMWMFHLVHHTDAHVDATTANRHHPGESVFRFAFTTLAVIVAGAPVWVIMLYQSCSVVLSQFNHANIRLPQWMDTALSWVIVSPNMHKVHHHHAMPYTDTNFGNIFALWDRLFGTFATLPPEHITYGLDTYPDPAEATHLPTVLRQPFGRYRPHH